MVYFSGLKYPLSWYVAQLLQLLVITVYNCDFTPRDMTLLRLLHGRNANQQDFSHQC